MKALPTMWTDAETTKSMNTCTDELTAHPDLQGIFDEEGRQYHSCAARAHLRGRSVPLISRQPVSVLLGGL
jgi:hypothetical protein